MMIRVMKTPCFSTLPSRRSGLRRPPRAGWHSRMFSFPDPLYHVLIAEAAAAEALADDGVTTDEDYVGTTEEDE